MNYVERYIEQFLRATVRNNIKHYLLMLDEKMKNLDDYMHYLITKKEQLSKLIDSLMLTLENKYIDIVEAFQIQQTSTEKIATEKTSYLINYMNAVA
ncbi:TPA: hypothetical protein P1V25_001645 [Staphylococcus aureus]|nr:hypothetical protein [Staphylococcus aureus]